MGAGQPGALQDQHGDQVLQPGACWQTGLGSVQGEAGQPLSFPSRPTPDMRLIHPPAGGFATFSSCFPGLCEGKPATLLPMSLSQPCLPVPSVGLTRILPHLYLGSQKDVLNKDLMTQKRNKLRPQRQQLLPQARLHLREPFPAHSHQ